MLDRYALSSKFGLVFRSSRRGFPERSCITVNDTFSRSSIAERSETAYPGRKLHRWISLSPVRAAVFR
jgi:hypothetical protein